MNEIFIVIIIALVGIVLYLYKQQSYIKTIDEYKDKLDENNELLNKKNI